MRVLVAALAAMCTDAYFVHTRSVEHKREAGLAAHDLWLPASTPPSDIITSWGETVSPNPPPLQEYPRPQLTRDSYINLCVREAVEVVCRLEFLCAAEMACGNFSSAAGSKRRHLSERR